jgi:hypothetical protein
MAASITWIALPLCKHCHSDIRRVCSFLIAVIVRSRPYWPPTGARLPGTWPRGQVHGRALAAGSRCTPHSSWRHRWRKAGHRGEKMCHPGCGRVCPPSPRWWSRPSGGNAWPTRTGGVSPGAIGSIFLRPSIAPCTGRYCRGLDTEDFCPPPRICSAQHIRRYVEFINMW